MTNISPISIRCYIEVSCHGIRPPMVASATMRSLAKKARNPRTLFHA